MCNSHYTISAESNVLIEKNASTFGNKMVCLGFWYLKETCYPVGRRGIHYKGTLELLNQFP